jgi:hypothetical protein
MKAIITFLTSIVLTFSVNAQTEKQKMQNIDKTIRDIKSNMSTFQKIERVNKPEAYSFVFLKDKELQLISVKVIEDNLEKNVEWYYVNDVLVYAETLWLDYKTKEVVKNEKMYLDNGHLIAWINPEGKFVDKSSSEFKNVDSTITDYGIQIKIDNIQDSLIIKDIQTILPIAADSVWIKSDEKNAITKFDRDNLFRILMKGLYSGKLIAYENYPKGELSIIEVNTKLTPWDSTNMAEDPNNPDFFVNAPIKRETSEDDILFIKFHEDIIFDKLTFKMDKKNSYLTLYWNQLDPRRRIIGIRKLFDVKLN